MAHEIDMTNNRANMAFVGDRANIWHGLGNELQSDASMETWCRQAGMDWDIKQTQVLYRDDNKDLRGFPNQTVLYRSDTQDQLSVVSGDYRIVQPREVLEFFSDLVTNLGMSLSTAGCLYGGRRFWALADTNNACDIVKNDTVKGMLLLTSACDGKRATVAQFTSVRVVCQNTLQISLNAENDSRQSITHRSQFDPTNLKVKLGVLDASWAQFKAQLKGMSKIKVTDKQAGEFYYELVADPKKLAADQSASVGKEVADLMQRYRNGMGAAMSYGTAWGLLNGSTEHSDNYGRAKSDSKLWGSWYGDRANQKNATFDALIKKFDLVTA